MQLSICLCFFWFFKLKWNELQEKKPIDVNNHWNAKLQPICREQTKSQNLKKTLEGKVVKP